MNVTFNDVIQELIDKNEERIDSLFVEEDFKTEYRLINAFLNELLERRKKDCEHEIFSIKNEVIDSGFMCRLCGKVFKEFQGVIDEN